MFPGFLTSTVAQSFFPKPLSSQMSEVRGKRSPERKFILFRKNLTDLGTVGRHVKKRMCH